MGGKKGIEIVRERKKMGVNKTNI